MAHHDALTLPGADVGRLAGALSVGDVQPSVRRFFAHQRLARRSTSMR